MSDVGLAQLRVLEDAGADPGAGGDRARRFVSRTPRTGGRSSSGAPRSSSTSWACPFTPQERMAEPRSIPLLLDVAGRRVRRPGAAVAGRLPQPAASPLRGNGYTYLQEAFLPRLREAGVSQAEIDQMTIRRESVSDAGCPGRESRADPGSDRGRRRPGERGPGGGAAPDEPVAAGRRASRTRIRGSASSITTSSVPTASRGSTASCGSGTRPSASSRSTTVTGSCSSGSGATPWTGTPGRSPRAGSRSARRSSTAPSASSPRRPASGPPIGARCCRFALSNSVTDEEGAIFVAAGLEAGEASPEPTEDLALRWVGLAEAVAMIDRGEITDAMSQLGILRVALERARD